MHTQSRREALNGRAAAFPVSELPLAAAFLLGASIAALLLRFPPEQYTFYPACPIYRTFHIECPGCGATRALAALLRGEVRQAIRDNALFVLGVLPGAIAYGAVAMMRWARRADRIWPVLPKSAIYASLATALIFTVARNLIHSFQR